MKLTIKEACSLFNELEKEIGLMEEYCVKNKTSIKEVYGEHAVHLKQIYLKLKDEIKR